jgi:Lipase (class 3)
MPAKNGYSTAEAQLLITLSGFAYMDSDPLPDESVEQQTARMRRDIDAALAASSYPSWHVVWGPGLSGDRANMLYAAGDSNSDRIAVAVRGTDWSFWLNWVEDLASVLPLVPFTYVLPAVHDGTPLIAVGTNIGLQLLITTQASTLDGQTMDLATFLRQAGAQARVFVTGHSLGGCLASVLAPALAYQLGNADNITVYTFAAPSAGNQDFVSYFDRLFSTATGAPTAYRVYNNLDIVPASWASLPRIARLYRPAPRCSVRMRQLVAWAQEKVGTDYQQVGKRTRGSAVELHGQLTAPHALPLTPDRGSVLFFYEVGQQHATETYMQLLEAPAIPHTLAKLNAVHSAFARRT